MEKFFIERFDITKKVGILGILGNVFLFIIKIVIGLISNSQSMIVDAINSAVDVFGSVMTTIGNKISSMPNDDDHNFGHGKAEYIFSLFISISIILLSLKMFFNSVLSMVEGSHFVFSYKLVLVCFITIIFKFILYLYTKNQYSKSKNILILSSMIDHRNDCIITMFTTVSILFSLVGIYFLDGVVGILISIWIIKTGIILFLESYKVLMDTSIDSSIKNEIIEKVLRYQQVKKVSEFYNVSVGYKFVIVIAIDVNGKI